jgi:arsenite methyltransferase
MRPVSTAQQADYGFDSPYVPISLGGSGLVLVAAGVVLAFAVGPFALALVAAGLFLVLSGISFVYTTRRGKLAVWTDLLAALPFAGHETVLDLGCGRGAVLVRAAKRVPRGRAIGVDIWRRVDQTGNHADATRRNLTTEGVSTRTSLCTGDMRALPVAGGAADAIVSSLAIHNIPDAAGRRQAIEEAYRAVRPGGRLLIADFRATSEHVETLHALGATDVASRSLGWRFWYGGPWAATRLVTATKPANLRHLGR